MIEFEAAGPVETWATLPNFGFHPDTSVMSEGEGSGLRLDMGPLRLTAAQLTNFYLRQVVQISGILTTTRSLSSIDIEMPLTLDSTSQVAAWIVWHLLQGADGRRFVQESSEAWIVEGVLSQGLLPWVAKRDRYNARPHCVVARQWLRVALNELSSLLEKQPDSAIVELSFDGKIFVFNTDLKVIPCPAEGTAWPHSFEIPAGGLRNLPRRLMRESIGISIWEGCLCIHNRLFQGVHQTAKALSGPS